MKTTIKYKSKEGKVYNCKILREDQFFADLEIDEKDDNTIFLKVNKSMLVKD